MIKSGIWNGRELRWKGVTDRAGQRESMQVQWHVLRAGGDLYLRQVRARQAAHFVI